MKKEIEAFVNAANEQELEAAWNNLSAEEQRVFEQLMEEDSPEDALAFFAQLYDDAPKEQTSETCIRQLIGTKNHFFPHYFIHKIKEQRVMQKSRSQHK